MYTTEGMNNLRRLYDSLRLIESVMFGATVNLVTRKLKINK